MPNLRRSIPDEAGVGVEVGSPPMTVAQAGGEFGGIVVRLHVPPPPVPVPARAEVTIAGIGFVQWLWTYEDWEATPIDRRPADDGRFTYFPKKGMLWTVPKTEDASRPWE